MEQRQETASDSKSVRHRPSAQDKAVARPFPSEDAAAPSSHETHINTATDTVSSPPKSKQRRNRNEQSDDSTKRRCISTACVACRRRKSKCDGNTPSCAACASVYGTPCVYDPNSDHRRKGVYKKDADSMKTRNSTLQVLISAILNYPQDEVQDLVREIRACENLEKVAEAIEARANGQEIDDKSDISPTSPTESNDTHSFERQLYSKVGELRLEDGSMRFIGGTSNLVYQDNDDSEVMDSSDPLPSMDSPGQAVSSWTAVAMEPENALHLLELYFNWHYPFFTVLSAPMFWRDFNRGNHGGIGRTTEYCSPLLVNVMLALGCHFSSAGFARSDPADSATAGDHFFAEAKRLINEGDEYEKPKMTTVQALALMSVREAGCGREAKGWVYSGIAFRMACDLGLNYGTEALANPDSHVNDSENDVRRVTFWGCFLVDKCWSNYLGRLPLFQTSNNITVPKFDVFPGEDSEDWSPCTDSGPIETHKQPSRLRAVSLQILTLCDISGDLMRHFYHPQDKFPSKQAELQRLSEIHTRLETWRRNLPKEMEPREGALPSVLVMHMFFQLLYIHLFRPFLKYSPNSSPLPSNVSPRKLCTNAAATISKLFRLYKRSYGLRQICNIAVYIAHSACTIHLLNLPDKNAARDISHGVRHLEEIADGWLCARRTLRVLSLQARKWRIDLPEDAAQTLARTDTKFGLLGSPLPGGRADHDQTIPAQFIPRPVNSFMTKKVQTTLQPPLDGMSVPVPGWYKSLQSGDTSGALNQLVKIERPDVPGNIFTRDAALQSQSQQRMGTLPGKVPYQGLLQQQQAWNEVAARTGIPMVVGQDTAPMQSNLHHDATPYISNQVTDVYGPDVASFDMQQPQSYGNHPSKQKQRYLPSPLTNMSGRRSPESALQTPRSQTSHTSWQSEFPGGPLRSGHLVNDSFQTRSSLTVSERPLDTSGNTAFGQIHRQRLSNAEMSGVARTLPHEGQDWWVEDQTQFVSGFNNWDSLSSTRRGSAADPASAAPTSENAAADNGMRLPADVGSGTGLPTFDFNNLNGVGSSYDDTEWFT